MELERLFKLIDAGFTKEDIKALINPTPTQPVAESNPQAEKLEDKPIKGEQLALDLEQQETPATSNEKENAELLALIDEVKGLRKQLQLNNIITDGLTPVNNDTVGDILASIINPTQPK